MSDGSLARRYARALVGLGQDAGLTDKFGADLGSFLDLINQEDGLLGSVLGNPGITTLERRAVLIRVLDGLSLHRVVKNFLKLLVDKNRFEHLADIYRAYGDMADDLAALLCHDGSPAHPRHIGSSAGHARRHYRQACHPRTARGPRYHGRHGRPLGRHRLRRQRACAPLVDARRHAASRGPGLRPLSGPLGPRPSLLPFHSPVIRSQERSDVPPRGRDQSDPQGSNQEL